MNDNSKHGWRDEEEDQKNKNIFDLNAKLFNKDCNNNKISIKELLLDKNRQRRATTCNIHKKFETYGLFCETWEKNKRFGVEKTKTLDYTSELDATLTEIQLHSGWV